MSTAPARRAQARRAQAKPPTLAEVADLAGVSVPTASRVLNGGVRGTRSGSPDLRDRVLAAAETLGYAPSPAAQTMKGGRANTIALLISDIEDAGSATIVAGVMHAAERRGLSIAVRATLDDRERELGLLRALRGERHRGVIVATSRTSVQERERKVQAQLQQLSRQGARVVVIGESTLGFPSVTVDNVGTARRLAEALVGGGARRFAVVAGPAEQLTSQRRLEGFVAGLEAVGGPIRVVHDDFSRQGGYRAVAELEPLLPTLDVVAAMSDGMAVGALVKLRELGAAVAGSVTVTGFDDVPMIGDLLPGFSTVAVPLEAFGEAAVSLAVDDVDASVQSITLRAHPIVEGVPLREP
jgi:LacI family transcriptional regulator